MPGSTVRGQTAHRNAVSMDIAGVASFLKDTLGQKLTAYIAQVEDARAVSQWGQGKRKPRPGTEERLRNAYHVFQRLQERESPHTVRAWFVGLNPELDHVSPAEALREGRFKEVMAAATAFLDGA